MQMTKNTRINPRKRCLTLILTLLPFTAIRAELPELGTNLEVLAAKDVFLADTLIYLLLPSGEQKTVLSYKHTDNWIDYSPPNSIFGDSVERYSEKDSLHLAAQGPLANDFLWLAEGGGYLGYSDFKSLWIDEYYRQLFEGYPGYKKGNPMGTDALLGLRWDYLQVSGFMKFSIFGALDRVSPQWDPIIGKGLTSSRTSLNSKGCRLELENVLSHRFRTHNSLTVSDSTDRSPRWSLETMDNYALSDSWVVRGTMGGAFENPDFHAFWTTAAVEWDYQQKWFLGLNARIYGDSGDTNDLITYGVNAPSATAYALTASLRCIEGPNQASIGIGPYWTRYHADKTSPVTKLYADRSWLWLQLAWSHQF